MRTPTSELAVPSENNAPHPHRPATPPPGNANLPIGVQHCQQPGHQSLTPRQRGVGIFPKLVARRLRRKPRTKKMLSRQTEEHNTAYDFSGAISACSAETA
jgi:hypothetical protein